MSNIHREDWHQGVDDEHNVGEPRPKKPRWLQNAVDGPEYYRDRKFSRKALRAKGNVP